jgi:predicted metal-dependent hydrolase
MDRYAPQFPLPPYSYVSGRAPHPINHPDGHRMGEVRYANEQLEPEDWRACDAFCFALDLFNAGFFWEAHEVWEGCWNATGRTGRTADFLKGLIKIAAALVKAREGRVAGVQRHARRGAELLRGTAAVNSRYAGLAIAELIKLTEQIDEQAEQLVVTPAVQRLEFVMRPR